MQHARGSCLRHRSRSPVGKSGAISGGNHGSSKIIRGHQRSSVALTSAPSERSHLAISRLPFMHASTNGSSPSSLGLVTDAPRARSALASSRSSSRTCHRRRQSRLIKDHQRSSEVIRDHQRSPEIIRGHQRSSEVIKGCQAHLPSREAITAHQSHSTGTPNLPPRDHLRTPLQ